MLFADSPREPLKAEGRSAGCVSAAAQWSPCHALGDHPAFSAQQVSWEFWIGASTQTLEFNLRGMPLVFRDFKISRCLVFDSLPFFCCC